MWEAIFELPYNIVLDFHCCDFLSDDCLNLVYCSTVFFNCIDLHVSVLLHTFALPLRLELKSKALIWKIYVLLLGNNQGNTGEKKSKFLSEPWYCPKSQGELIYRWELIMYYRPTTLKFNPWWKMCLDKALFVYLQNWEFLKELETCAGDELKFPKQKSLVRNGRVGMSASIWMIFLTITNQV